MKPSVRVLSVLLVSAPFLLAARAGDAGGRRCAELELKASAKAAAATLACFRKAASRAGTVSETCLDLAMKGLNEAFGRAKARRACPDRESLEEITDEIDALNRRYARALTDVLTPEICDDGIDQNMDGDVDCEDGDCYDEAACGEDCRNRIDDNGDGLVDCLDARCRFTTDCREFNCSNGIDDDGLGDIDCADPDCAYVRSCGEDCGNGIDDNGDGLVDCRDSSRCANAPACREAECVNGADDDGDGSVDCVDPDCGQSDGCREDCANGVDDNRNGLVDCSDTQQCTGAPPCIESSCTNRIDDDADGALDCAEQECFRDPACAEVCDNGVDDNLNGLVDCADDPYCGTARVCSTRGNQEGH